MSIKGSLYVRAEIGSVFLGPLRGAWTLTQAQSRPLLAILKQGQAWGGMRSRRGAGKVALHREKCEGSEQGLCGSREASLAQLLTPSPFSPSS